MPNVKNYNEQGGARTVIGGSLDVASGGDLDIESGGALKIAGTQVTASAAELNQLDAALAGATFTVGAETGNAITVAVQLTDAQGAALAHRAGVYMYISDDVNGDSVATAVSEIAAGTDGLFIAHVAGQAGEAVSEADGDIDIVVTNSNTGTIYLAVVLPDGSLATSTGLTFA